MATFVHVWTPLRVLKYGRLYGFQVWTPLRVVKYGRLYGFSSMDASTGSQVQVWTPLRFSSMDASTGCQVCTLLRVVKYGRLYGFSSMDASTGSPVWTPLRVVKYGRLYGFSSMDASTGSQVQVWTPLRFSSMDASTGCQVCTLLRVVKYGRLYGFSSMDASTGSQYGRLYGFSSIEASTVSQVWTLLRVLMYGRLYAAELRAGNCSQDPYTLYTDCEKRVLRPDQASPVSLVPSTHLTGEHKFALLLLILGVIETNPGLTPCAICHRSNWNQYGGCGGWVNLNCTNLQSIEQWNNKFDCKRCSRCKTIEANTKQNFPTHDNAPQYSPTEL